VFDGETLQLQRSMRPGSGLSGIATSADGSKLYLGKANRILEVDAGTGQRLRTISIPGARGLSVLP